MKLKEKNLGYTVAILSIFTAFIMITEWKKYEQKIINDSAKPVIDSLNYDATVSFKTAEKKWPNYFIQPGLDFGFKF